MFMIGQLSSANNSHALSVSFLSIQQFEKKKKEFFVVVVVVVVREN